MAKLCKVTAKVHMSKYWCFTWNNPTEESIDAIQLLVSVLLGGDENLTGYLPVSYLVVGTERGSGTGTKHLQGYVEFSAQQRKDRVCKALRSIRNPKTDCAHVEKRYAKSSSIQASTYCKKDGDYFEAGTLSSPNQGKRVDLDEIRMRIRGGISELELANEYFGQWLFHRRAFITYRELLLPERSVDAGIEVYLLWGETEMGKSRYVFSKTRGAVFTVPDKSLRWFDGYCGESDVQISEFQGERAAVDVGLFLDVTDRYPLRVPVKGGFVRWLPRRIWITSNRSFENWWPNIDELTFGAIRRRLSRVVELKQKLIFDGMLCLNDPFPDLVIE